MTPFLMQIGIIFPRNNGLTYVDIEQVRKNGVVSTSARNVNFSAVLATNVSGTGVD